MAVGKREQPVHRVLVGEIQVVQLASLVDTAFQGPARLQLQGHEPIGIASGNSGLTDQEWCPLLGIEGLEPQRRTGLLEPEAEAGSKVLATAAQRVAIAVQVALADTAEVEAIQAGLHQSVLACPPAARLGLDLFQHKQFPLGPAKGLCEHSKALLRDGYAVKRRSCCALLRQASNEPHGSQTGSPQVGSAHAR